MADTTTTGRPARPRLGAFLEPLPAGRGGRTLLVVAMLVIGLWLVGVLLPYYVQDIDDLPSNEVGGLDASGLWPATAGPLGRLVQTLGVLTALGLGPMVLFCSACGAAWSLVGRWHLLGRTPRATYLAVIALSLLGTAGMMVTFRGNLETWMLD